MALSFFHLHLISDSTGETLLAVGRAATAQYNEIAAIEHVYPLTRNSNQLQRALTEIEANPGIVLYTMVDAEISQQLEAACKEIGCPCHSVLNPILGLFQAYLGLTTTSKPGAQHTLNAEYFRRIEAINFTLLHDDGQNIAHFNDADVVLLGISRTSKTPTSIYLANRGVKTANLPLVPQIPVPDSVLNLEHPIIVGLIATPERIIQIRQNRLLTLNADMENTYVDREHVIEEISQARRLFARHNWPVIDVSRRSIEEIAAEIIDLYKNFKAENEKLT